MQPCLHPPRRIDDDTEAEVLWIVGLYHLHMTNEMPAVSFKADIVTSGGHPTFAHSLMHVRM